MRISNRIRVFPVFLLVIVFCSLSPSGGVSSRNAQPGEFFVPPEQAFVHAAAALVEGALSRAPSLIGRGEPMEEWRSGMLGDPLILYDLTREALFYSYPVMTIEGRMLGRIWVSASKLVGASVCSFIIGPRTWSIEEARGRAEAMASETYPGWELVAFHPVVYSYPKVGVMLTLRDPRTGESALLVVDAADFTPVPIRGSEPDVRGIGLWPFLDNIPREEWGFRIERWQADNDRAAGVQLRLLREFDIDLLALMARPLVAEEWRIVQAVFQQSTNCSTCIVGNGIPAPGGIDQFCQENNYYCTVATGQMIAAFHGMHHTQTHIASVMGTTTGGTMTEGELKYFRDAAKGLGRACSDYDRTTTDWNEFANEICAGRPFDSSLPNHSRTAAGARSCQTDTGIKRYIGIVDPWPPNRGCGERWDDWDAVTLFEHVWARHCP